MAIFDDFFDWKTFKIRLVYFNCILKEIVNEFNSRFVALGSGKVTIMFSNHKKKQKYLEIRPSVCFLSYICLAG